MLQLYSLDHYKLHGLTKYKDLKRERELAGEEFLSFSYPQSCTKYKDIKEETYIRTKDNEYVVKEINIQDDWTEFVCKINIENIKGNPFSHFESVERTCTSVINLALAGTGWTIGSCDVIKLRTVRKNNCSSWDILQEIRKIYRCDFRFNAIEKKIYIYQSMGNDKGTYFTEQLNLRSLDIQSDSYDYCTRIIPIGKDDMNIKTINDGKEYVENYQYSDKVITKYWEDNRYTVVENLKEDAIARLNELSKPRRAYKADILDLAKFNDKYKNILDYDLGDTITLLSKDKKVKDKQRIVKVIEYPDEPEKNTCEIANRVMSLEDLQVDFIETTETVDSITTSDGMIDSSKVDLNPLRLEVVSLVAQKADVGDLNAAIGRIGTLEATTATITQLNATNANITNLQANSATITQLTAATGRITTLESRAASIDTLLAGNISADNMQAGFITAESGLIANGAISDAMIQDLGVSKIKAGNISTNKFVVTSDSGNLKIQDNTLKVWDTTGKERVSLGLNGNDYNLLVRGADGNTVLFGTDGVTNEGITEGAVDDSKIATNANINAGKIEKESLVSQINGANTSLKASKVKLDTENQTLDLAFTGLKSTITDTNKEVTSQGTAIKAIQGQISSKIWQQDVTTAVDNIQVGGRNLLIDRNITKGYYIDNNGGLIANNNSITSDFIAVGYTKPYIITNANDVGNYIKRIAYYDANKIFIRRDLVYAPISTELTNIPSNCKYIRFSTDSYIKDKCKIEPGNKPTDWSPAPEDIDAQITTISDKYTSISQNLSGITTEVNNLKTTTNDLNKTVSSQGTKVEQLSNSITQKVWSTDIDNSINNINIGGRNLILDSKDEWVTPGLSSNNGYYGAYKNQNLTSLFSTLINKEVTFSFDVKVSTIGDVKFYCSNGAPKYYFQEKIFTNISTEYRRVNYTTIIKESIVNTGIAKLEFWGISDYRKVFIKNLKLEVGNKPTDWSPAPEDTDAQIDSIATRMNTAEQTIKPDAIVSTVRSSTTYKSDLSAKISTANLSTEIQQRAGDVQVAFNNISSNINNSSGMFTIKNGAMRVLSGSGRTAFRVDTDGYIFNEWGVKSQCPPGQIIPVFGHTLADGNCSTLLRPFGLWHESIDDKYQMRIGSKNMIQFVNLADEWQDIGCRWAYVNQIRTSSLDGGAAVMRGNAIDSLEASSTRLWLNYYSGKSVCVGDGTRGGYGSLSCQDFNAYGSKNAVVKTKDYGDLAINAYETAEYYFGDIGSGKLENGECIVYVDDIFKTTVNTDIVYHVFLTKYGEGDIWVSERHKDYFVVRGTEDIEFGWELKAKRIGYENNRLIDIKKDDMLLDGTRSQLSLDAEMRQNFSNAESDIENINNFNIENILLGDDLIE